MARTGTVVALLAVGLLTTGASCSFSMGSTPSVAADELAREVSDQLTQQVGTAPRSVECPEDLTGEVGTTTRCVLTTPGGTVYGVTVDVTAVEGSDIRFSIEVDDTPTR